MKSKKLYFIYLGCIVLLTVGGIYFFKAQKRKRGIAVEQAEGQTEAPDSWNGLSNDSYKDGKASTLHFTSAEFDCNDGTAVPEKYMGNVQTLMNNLEVLRSEIGDKPITIDSGYRTVEHNAAVGGEANSQHLYGKAADIKVSGFTPAQVAAKIEELIQAGKMMQGGLGLYSTWVHYDIRGNKARW